MTLKLIKTAPTAQQDDAVNREATALLQRWTAAVVRDRALRVGSYQFATITHDGKPTS